MAVSLSTIAAKDSGGTAIAGGLQAQDKSGAGTGPFTLGQILIDGVAGVNMAQVTAANAVKVDGSAVTQPVSIATAPVLVAGSAIIGKVGVDQTTPGTTNAVAVSHIGSTAVATGSGVMTAGVQRMALATDSPGIIGTAALTAATAPSTAIATLAQYNATNPAPTDAQTVALQVDPNGKLLVQPYGNPANYVSGAITTAMTGTTTTSLIAAPAAGLRNYITQITVSNAHATVGTDVIIQDGSGGTTLYTIPAAAVYGGATITFPTPLRQPTTATAIFCANVTTGASTKVSASGYKGA